MVTFVGSTIYRRLGPDRKWGVHMAAFVGRTKWSQVPRLVTIRAVFLEPQLVQEEAPGTRCSVFRWMWVKPGLEGEEGSSRGFLR